MAVDSFDERACELGEGPWYDERTDRANWVDILGPSVLWRELASGRTGALAAPSHIGAAVPREDGGLVLCLRDGPVLLDPDGGRHELGTFADADAAAGSPRGADDPPRRANDAKADPFGRLWLGTMAYDTTPGAGALYRLDPGATAPVRVLGEVTVSNGLGWSLDGSLMYYIDTPTRNIDVFDYDGTTGAMVNRRHLVTIEEGAGMPDGMCVDSAGGIWVALHEGGAVRRYLPDGFLDREVDVGVPLVTSCAFVGEAFDRLIITTAQGDEPVAGSGVTYVHRPGDVTGAPVHRYAA